MLAPLVALFGPHIWVGRALTLRHRWFWAG